MEQTNGPKNQNKEEQDLMIHCQLCNQKMNIPPSETNIPKILPCLHTFCSSCLSQNNKDKFQCPNCKKTHQIQVDKLPNNFAAICVLESVLHQNDPLKCDFCEGAALYKCVDCDVLYCETHKSSHPKKFQSTHNFISLNDTKSPLISPIVLKCDRAGHKMKELDIFCEKCDQLVCQNCIIADYSQPGHNALTLDDAVKKYQPVVEKLLIKIGNKISLIDEATGKINETIDQAKLKSDEIKERIKRESEEFIKAIKEREKRLIAQCDIKQIKLKDQLNSLKIQKEGILNIQKFVQKTLNLIPKKEQSNNNNNNENSNISEKAGGELPFLSIKSIIVARLEELSVVADNEFEPCETKEMEFISFNKKSFNEIENDNHDMLCKLISKMGEVLNYSNVSPFAKNCFIEEIQKKKNISITNETERSVIVKCFNMKGERIITQNSNNNNNDKSSQYFPQVSFKGYSNQQLNVGVEKIIDENDKGIDYQIFFTPKEIGNLFMNVTFESYNICDSPFCFNVVPKVVPNPVPPNQMRFDSSFCGSNITLSGKGSVATKTSGGSSNNSSVLGTIPNPKTFKVKILSTVIQMDVGLAPKQNFEPNGQNYGSCGWFLYCGSGSLDTSCGAIVNGNYPDPLNSGDVIEVKYDRKNRTIHFIVNNIDKNVFFSNVNPDDLDLFPAIDFNSQTESVQFEF